MPCSQHNVNTGGCPDCQRYGRHYWHRRETAIAHGTWLPRQPAETVRAHLAACVEAGMPLRDIARRTGVAYPTICDIWQQQRRWVNGPTAALLLAVTPRRVAPVGLVDAEVPGRKVRALTRLGWCLRVQARETGLGVRALGRLANGHQQHVTTVTATKVAALYRRWSTMRCPDTTRPARYAIKKGWPGPIAWANIDDPACQPDTANTATGRPHASDVLSSNVDDALDGLLTHDALTTAERIRVVTILARRGWTDVRIGEWLGWPQSESDGSHKHSPVLRFRRYHHIPTGLTVARDVAFEDVRQLARTTATAA